MVRALYEVYKGLEDVVFFIRKMYSQATSMPWKIDSCGLDVLLGYQPCMDSGLLCSNRQGSRCKGFVGSLTKIELGAGIMTYNMLSLGWY